MTKNGNEIKITDSESMVCKICNKKFDSNRKMIWHVRKTHQLSFEQYIIQSFYNGVKPVCLKTGKSLSFKAHKLGPWFSNFSKNSFPRKPHTDETKKKIKNGCEKVSMEKFGVKNVFSTDWCKKKIKQTMISKYGVENIMQSPLTKELLSKIEKSQETINKTKTTNIKKYGATTYTSTDESKLKLRDYNYRKHYDDWDKYSNVLNNIGIECIDGEEKIGKSIPMKFKCINCGHLWNDTLLIPVCHECINKFRNARSIEESNLMKWIKKEVPYNFITNKRFKIDGKTYESDICFQDKKIIIELNGLFWHSEKAGKDKTYHIKKLLALESLGYSVFQIFEDEWLFKTNLVKNKILHKLGASNYSKKIYARKCKIKKISNKESNDFLSYTHIQGPVNTSYCYGAYYNDELVAVMTFSKPRVNMGNKNISSEVYELVRFSTLPGYRIVGAAGKLLSYFINDKKPNKIISYADRRWSNDSDNLYKKLGFKLTEKTSPNYWYVKKYNREYRFKFTKQKLIKMGYDPNKTEREIMKELGYDRIWDCGHLKYELYLSNLIFIDI